MASRSRTAERLVGLACLAALLFNPPILALFSVEATLLGTPLLFLYIYAAWAAVILVIAVTAGRAGRHLDRSRSSPDRATRPREPV